MSYKIIIGILVFLVLISGGLGAYSVILNRQIDTLGNELTALKGETATEISDVRGSISTLDTELTAFKGETATEISDVRGNISTLDTDLTAFKGETATEISDVRGNISTLDTDLTAFKGETATELSQSTLNAQRLYEGVREGVCEITDGEYFHGSGFVFDTEGYIVTAQHVIDELNKIDVILYDGTICAASVVGSCEYSDVAVLKIRKTATPQPLELADSNAVTPGELVMTLGSPFYLSGTVTSGIVSETGRAAVIADNNWPTTNLIQYDAATNYGNSGGPVFNSEGKIIGMSIALLDPASSSGIYMAVSSNKIKRVADSIIDSGSFENATLPGTWTVTNLTPEEARDRNRETTNGVLFLEAEGVDGIQADDLVVAVDGLPVLEFADLLNYFGEHKSPDDTVTLTVIRHGTEVEVEVELVEGAYSIG